MRAASAASLVLVAALTARSGRLPAQSVVELNAGGSSLYDAYGLSGTLYTPRFETWLGVGWQNGGVRVGGALQTSFGRDSLRVGSDVLLQRYPTDLFSIGVNVLTQDVRYTLVTPRTVAAFYGGAAAAGPTSQFFQAFSFDAPFAGATVRHLLRPRVALGANAMIAEEQTLIGTAEWLAAPPLTVALTTGMGANAPYGAVSVAYRTNTLAARASFTAFGDGFRRVALPYPTQSEPERENLQVDWTPIPNLALGAARQNFAQDSSGNGSAPLIRASSLSFYAGYRLRGLRGQAGVFDSRSQGVSNFNNYFALGASIGSRFDVEGYLLQSRPSNADASTTPVVNLRERITQRLALLQQVSWSDGKATVRVGGDLVTPFGDLGVSYSLVQQPFQPDKPFASVLGITARLQFGRFGTAVSTTFLPDGSVAYVANANTFLYFSQFGGLQPNLVAPRVGRFVLRGRVVDVEGHGVDGAALDFDGEVAFTNPEGEFLIRVRRPRTFPLTIRFDEFLQPGEWEVVSAPPQVTATIEEKATSVEIILRRREAPPAGEMR